MVTIDNLMKKIVDGCLVQCEVAEDVKNVDDCFTMVLRMCHTIFEIRSIMPNLFTGDYKVNHLPRD